MLVCFAQTNLGKTVLLLIFWLEFCVFSRDHLTVMMALSIAIATFIPRARRLVLAAAPIVVVLAERFRTPLFLVLNLGVMTVGILLYWGSIQSKGSWFARRPIVFLLSGFSFLILGVSTVSPHSRFHTTLWDVVGLAANYVWFVGYALADRNSEPRGDLTLQLATFRPIWGSTNTPFPKGASYLRKIEAHNPEQLAITQLKGVKLLSWAIAIALFSVLWQRLFHGYLGIPSAAEAFAMSAEHHPVAWHVRWESQILAYFEMILSFSIFGHKFIAVCRMAGFNALRNTYRPLSASTLSEFFNRFYFYFKELLVDFFFYPAFLRYWKPHRRLRLLFATFSAAFFGNAFYHFTRDWQFIRDAGLWKALCSYQVYLFYCACLATGLGISQLRRKGLRPTGLLRRRIIPACGVGMFYCLLNVFATEDRTYSLTEHLRFLAALFFIHF